MRRKGRGRAEEEDVKVEKRQIEDNLVKKDRRNERK